MKYFFNILLIIFIQGFFSEISGQSKFQDNLIFEKNSYTTYTIKLDSSTLKNFKFVKNDFRLNHKDFIEQYLANNDSNFFAINACINNTKSEPLGLLISNRQELNSINLMDGSGNFFLKPNGVIIFTEKNVFISESKNFKKDKDIVNAVQSGPMLVINHTIHPLFNSSSTNKNMRCGVGTFIENNDKWIVFAISNKPVNFFDFATLFKNNFHCNNALCLESSNSVMFTPEIGVNNLAEDKFIGNYLLFDPILSNSKKRNYIIPMKLTSSGIYEVPVELNKVLKISFIFDSGASDVCISPDVALTLFRTGTISDKDYIGTQEYVFADGSKATSSVFILHELNIGGYIIKNVRASISNSINAPMLLGQTVMQRLGKFTIDNIHHTLSFENN